MISRKKIDDEIKRLEESIQEKKRIVAKAPKGKLECHRDKKHWNWYVVNDIEDNEGNVKKKRKYIKKSEIAFAENLAEKEVRLNEIKDEEQELRALKMYINNRSKFERVNAYLNKSEEHRRLARKICETEWPKEIQAWLNEENDVPPYKPEQLKRRCRNNLWVRSKSEQLICGALFYHKIPFKYEQPLYINGHMVIPDFTIRSPYNGRTIIWEHFGMMSNPLYAEKNIGKLREYISNGYIPFENLLTTFESSDGGIDEVWIDRIIETYFLSI